MANTVSDMERTKLLATAPGALATDTLADLRLKRYKTATPGLLSVSDFEKPYIEAAISNEVPQDTLYSLRRKHYALRGSLSGVGLTTDDMHWAVQNAGL